MRRFPRLLPAMKKADGRKPMPKSLPESEIRPPIRHTTPQIDFSHIAQVLPSVQITGVMSLQPSESIAANGTNRSEVTEVLKVWSCVKVRCDRRHPCAPCTRNDAECVFPISGRIPRRGHDFNASAQKKAELLGRLRRLEAMVGGLSSQVEHAEAADQSNHPGKSSVNVQTEPVLTKNTSESPHLSGEFGELVLANNGNLIVGNQFWTVFCKEV
jgi:hypothetical protein